MEIFVHLFQNLIPLYGLIALGWIAGRYFEVDKHSLGAMGIFILAPIVSFGYVAKLEFQLNLIALPIIVFILFSVVLLMFYNIGRKVYADKSANLLGMCAGMGNTGYFGLPLALLLLEPQWIGVYILANLGGLICECTIMYYIANRSQFTVKDSLKKLLTFPTIYAIAAGLLVNYLGVTLSDQMNTYLDYFKGAYIIIGMMIIGAALSAVQKIVIGPKFLSLSILGKFIVWPALALAIIWADMTLFHIFEKEVHQILFLISIVPHGANTAAYAAKLNIEPEKAATTILIGTILALISIPLMISVTGLL